MPSSLLGTSGDLYSASRASREYEMGEREVLEEGEFLADDEDAVVEVHDELHYC